MGFKRTADGRVFFQNIGQETANDPADHTQIFPEKGQRPQPQQQDKFSQVEVLGLLRTLNEHLKETQKERDQIRKQLSAQRQIVKKLEERAERGENAYRDLRRSIAQKKGEADEAGSKIEMEIREARLSLTAIRDEVTHARRVGQDLSRKQTALETLQKEQEQRLASQSSGYAKVTQRLKASEERQQELDEKLEQTTSQHSKLVRKMDKASQERGRFLRKMDRIEEIVLQTQDALTARAMVLLTDQTGEGQSQERGARQTEPAQKQAERNSKVMPSYADKPAFAEKIFAVFHWMKRSVNVQTVVMAGAIIAGVSVGWVLSRTQISSVLMDQVAAIGQMEISSEQGLPPVSDIEVSPNFEPIAADIEDVPAPAIDEKAAILLEEQSATQHEPKEFQAIEAVSEEAALPTQKQKSQEKQLAGIISDPSENDIGAIDLRDENELLAALSDDQNALAGKLDTIEPANVGLSAMPAPPKVDDAKQVKPAAFTPPGNDGTNADNFVPQKEVFKSASRDQLEARIIPDGTLPPVLKKLEDKAYSGVAEAQHDLAAVYAAGHAGARQSYVRAALWFEAAADQGIANARYNLGVLYHQGLGVEQSLNKAIQWYVGAANLGHPEAQYNLGIAYIEGVGVLYDPFKAAEYFEQAANGGVSEAAYNLGLIFENGLLGDSEPEQALMWYKYAADGGNIEAKAALKQLSKSLGISLSDVNRIVDRLRSQAGLNVGAGETQNTDALSKRRLLVKQIQEQLLAVGMYDGALDGLNGPMTQEAIRSYQALNSLKIDGNPSDELLANLLMQGAVLQ